MPNILVGQELGEDLFRINAQLRADTVNEYNKTAAEPVMAYSPWLGMRPFMPHVELPPSILRQPTFTRGGLVDDEEYLREAKAFMAPLPELTRNGIFDQKHEDWLAETSVTERQMKIFAEGRATLLAASTTLGRTYLELIDFVLPLPGQRNRGTSNQVTRGLIMRTIPDEDNKYDVAIDLAHEMGHYGLMVLQSVDPIISSDRSKMVYSQIRKHLRPAMQTFHAAVALAFMHSVVASMPDNAECQATGLRRGKKYSETFQHSLRLSLDSLARECEFTALGRRLVAEMYDLC